MIPHVYSGKDQTFIFGDYEGTRVRRAQTNNNLVPTAAQRGDFSGGKPITDPLTGQPFQGNVIPANRISPQAEFYLPFYPAANTSAGLTISFQLCGTQ